MVYNRGELPSPELQELLKKIQSLQGLCELVIANCKLRHPGLAAIQPGLPLIGPGSVGLLAQNKKRGKVGKIAEFLR